MMETEVVHVQGERSILVLMNHLPYFIDIARLAVGGHAHDFVFAFIYFEAEKSSERAV